MHAKEERSWRRFSIGLFRKTTEESNQNDENHHILSMHDINTDNSGNQGNDYNNLENVFDMMNKLSQATEWTKEDITSKDPQCS